MKEAWLRGNRQDLLKAIKIGEENNKEGQLDKALEICKNRVEILNVNDTSKSTEEAKAQ